MLLTSGGVSGINTIGSGSIISLITVGIAASNWTFGSITGAAWGGIILTVGGTGASSGSAAWVSEMSWEYSSWMSWKKCLVYSICSRKYCSWMRRVSLCWEWNCIMLRSKLSMITCLIWAASAEDLTLANNLFCCCINWKKVLVYSIWWFRYVLWISKFSLWLYWNWLRSCSKLVRIFWQFISLSGVFIFPPRGANNCGLGSIWDSFMMVAVVIWGCNWVSISACFLCPLPWPLCPLLGEILASSEWSISRFFNSWISGLFNPWITEILCPSCKLSAKAFLVLSEM